jgi:hypothetical protein
MDDRSVDIILKLFDQMKESWEKTDKQIEDLSAVVKSLFNTSSSPTHKDISDLICKLQNDLDDHDKAILTINPATNIKDIKDKLSNIHTDLDKHDKAIDVPKMNIKDIKDKLSNIHTDLDKHDKAIDVPKMNIKDTKKILMNIKDTIESVSKKVTHTIIIITTIAAVFGGVYLWINSDMDDKIEKKLMIYGKDHKELLTKPDEIKRIINDLMIKMKKHIEDEESGR